MNDTGGVTMTQISQLREEFGFSPSRALGQNFLIDANISAKIADAVETSPVLEVGPGLGSLTVQLACRCDHVHAIEFDMHIIEPLKHVLSGFGVVDKVSITRDDIMKVDIQSVCTSEGISTIAGNLPYNISAPLLVDIARFAPVVTTVVAMVQKEVADRFCALEQTRQISAATLKTLYFMEIEKLFDVGQNSFYPAPKVESSVIKMVRRDQPLVDVDDVEAFFSLIDTSFNQRRKMLRKSYSTLFGERANDIFQQANVDPMFRPEQCTLADFARLYLAWKVSE